MKMTCFTFAFKYLTSCTFLGKIGKYLKPCVGEGLCGTFANSVFLVPSGTHYC